MSTEAAEQLDIVYALAASPGFGRDGVCLAASSTGLFRSDDGGRSWRAAYASLQLTGALSTLAVAFSPDFAADRTLFVGVRGGLVYSTDAGETWRVGLLAEPPPTVSALAVSPNYSEDGTLLAGTLVDGILRSTDRGRNWIASNFGLMDLNVLCLALSPGFAEDETVVAGTESGLYLSLNGGRSWREAPFPEEQTPVLSLALSPSFPQDGLMLVGTEPGGLLRSTDQGRTWNSVSEGQWDGPVNAVAAFPGADSGPSLLIHAGDRALASQDGGRSWHDWPPGSTLPPDVTAINAPQGLALGAPLLVGSADGQVHRIT